MEEDVEGTGKEVDDLEYIVENLDNTQYENNLKLRGLKEGIDGQDLSSYLIYSQAG